MSTLAAWSFPTLDATRVAEAALLSLSRRLLINADDVASVVWPPADAAPTAVHAAALVGDGTFGPLFWDVLLAVAFVLPGRRGRDIATHGRGADLDLVGIDAGFLRRLRSMLKPGTSGLLAIAPPAVVGELDRCLPIEGRRLTTARLDEAAQARLLVAFHDAE